MPEHRCLPLLPRAGTPVLLGLCLLLLLAACGTPEPAPAAAAAESPPPVEARASVDKAVATTGDLITYTISVDHDPAYEVEIPEAGADIAGFRIVDIGHEGPITRDGRITVKHWYQLRADLVGSYVLPPVVVSYRPVAGESGEETAENDAPVADEAGGETQPEDQAAAQAEQQVVETSAIFVEVESVLPETGDATDIRDIKPLQPKPSLVPWPWIIGGVALLLVLLVAARLLWRRHTREIPPPPPHELAFRALDALRGTDFDDPEAVRRFYFAISEVLRGYVEGRFGLNATDLTTDEIFARLPELHGLAKEPEGELRRFLVDTDQVKFAAHRPAQEEIEQVYERALGFVETTRPVENEAPAPHPTATETTTESTDTRSTGTPDEPSSSTGEGTAEP